MINFFEQYSFLFARRWPTLRCSVVALLLAVCPRLVLAQRGEVPTPHTVSTASRLDGFPGSFNAAMVVRGHWTIDVLPLPSLSYGLHADATVRLGLAHLVAFSNGYGFSGELRYRVWHNANDSVVSSVAGTLLQSNTKFKNGQTTDLATGKEMPAYITAESIHSVQITVTGEHRWSPRTATALTFMAGGIFVSVEQPLTIGSAAKMSLSTSLQGAGAMVSHTYFPASWVGFDFGVGSTPYLENIQYGAGDIDLTKIGNSRGGFSARFNLYLRSEKWLFSVGAIMLPPKKLVPVVGVSRSW
jgi:hypothetical protein